jgi:hypothetical protein
MLLDRRQRRSKNYVKMVFKICCEYVFVFMSTGWDYISELRPPMGILFMTKLYMSMESHGGMILTGENEISGRNFCPSVSLTSHIPHGLTRAQTRASEVTGRLLTVWAMTRPFCEHVSWNKMAVSLAFVKTVMNESSCSVKWQNFLTSCTTVNFSRRPCTIELEASLSYVFESKHWWNINHISGIFMKYFYRAKKGRFKLNYSL